MCTRRDRAADAGPVGDVLAMQAGRQRLEEQDPIRPASGTAPGAPPGRRSGGSAKTQVFLSPEGDTHRTRLPTRWKSPRSPAPSPWARCGSMDQLTPGGFKHYMQSLRVVDKLEKDGQGPNLTWEVRNGIVTHTKAFWAATPEAASCGWPTQIAHVNHDYRGRRPAGVLDPATLPKAVLQSSC